MKLLKKLSFLILCISISGITLLSCSDNDPIIPDDDDYDMSQDPAYDPDYVFPTGEHNVVYTYPAYVSSSIDGDLKEALDLCLSVKVSAVDGTTKLIIIKNFKEISESAFLEAFNNGATIGVVNPADADIQSFVDSHPELNICYSQSNVGDDALIYYFDNGNCSGIVLNEPLTSTLQDETLQDYDFDEETVLTGEHIYSDCYTLVGSWLEHLIADEQEAIKGGAANGLLPSVEDLAVNHHYSITFNIKQDNVVRKCFSISGTGAVTVSYDVHQLHVYQDGNNGGGNYYLVSMAASAANENMYKGMASTWKWKYFCVTHRIGYICTDFTVESSLKEKDGETTVANILFPASGSPLPETTVGSTSYTSGSQFSIGGDAGWSQEEGFNGGVNMGASWSSSQSRSISDVDIQNLTSSVSPKWKLNFNNIPYYSDECKFKEHNGVTAFRSTQYLYAQWVWYEPDAPDDSSQDVRYLRVDGNINHKAMSFFTTRADLDTKNYITNFTHKFQLDPIYTKRKAGIRFRNTTGNYVNNIKVLNTKDNSVVYAYPNACGAGDEVIIGWFEVKDKSYTLSYDMNGDTYRYSLNNGVLNLENATKTDHTLTVFAKEEFSK